MAATPHELAADLLKLASVPPHAIDSVQFVGPRTVLPSSFRVTDATAALVAATSAAVAAVADLRAPGVSRTEARRDAIQVDTVGATVAFHSERHLRLADPPQLWDGLSGHYRTADGHIQFHTNFEHHKSALLEVTGCRPDADRAEVAAVVSTEPRFTLERAVAEAGGIAAALRSADEWSESDHARWVDGRPPLTITSPSPGPPRPMPDTDRAKPLAGIRVLDLTRVIAGPVCARTLAAYGADVLRIGSADLPVVESILPDTTLGKRFAHCDITTATGRDTVLRLAADADVVISGFRPGALDGYGVGHDDLLEANPDLVLARLSAFGVDGPWGGKRGFDSITQTATGIVSMESSAFEQEKPRPLPCQLLDHGSGFLLSLGVLSALLRRHAEGGAQLVEASLLTTRNWLESLGRADPTQGRAPTAEEVAPFIATRPSPYGAMSHARHPGRIDGVDSNWVSGPSRPGADQAQWLDRG